MAYRPGPSYACQSCDRRRHATAGATNSADSHLERPGAKHVRRSTASFRIGDEIFLDHVGHFVRDPRRREPRARARGLCPDAGRPFRSIPIRRAVRRSRTGTGNVTAMFSRGYIEVLFKTADTPLGRELDAALARYGGRPSRGLRGRGCRRGASRGSSRAGFRMRPLVAHAAPGRHRRRARAPRPSRSRGVEPGEMPEGRIQILTHRTEAHGVAAALAVASQRRARPRRAS